MRRLFFVYERTDKFGTGLQSDNSISEALIRGKFLM